MAPHLQDIRHEEFWIILLNRANRVIKPVKISQGGTEGTVVDVKILMKEALNTLSSAVILAHNHPSGNLRPSESDIQLTKRISEAGDILGVRVLDHLIVANTGYYSFADEGLI